MGRGDTGSGGRGEPRADAQRRSEPGLARSPRPRLPCRAGGGQSRGARGREAGRGVPVARGHATALPEHGVLVAARLRRPGRRGEDARREEPAGRGPRPRAVTGAVPARPEYFLTPSDLSAWFAAHESAPELWVGFWKKGVERPRLENGRAPPRGG